MPNSDETFLITGSFGCIGAWVLRTLVRDGARVVATDLSDDPVRPALVMSEEELAAVEFRQLDVTDRDAVVRLVAESGTTHVIHLAGLQVPFCRANPTLGAMVNVVGTVNICEAVKEAGDQIQGFSYASSQAVFGVPELYPEKPVPDSARLVPDTLYGVYKQANEGTLRVYWEEYGISSVGLRPYIVYGVARDQGMTSDIAKAILAAVAGQPYTLRFDGPVALQLAADTARIFIACARSGHRGAAACNLRNDVVTVQEFVTELRRQFPTADLSWTDNSPLPFPHDMDVSGLRSILGTVPHTPLPQGIADTAAHFGELLADNRIDLGQLDG